MPIFKIEKRVSFSQVAYIEANSEEAAYDYFENYLDPAEIKYDSNYEPTEIVEDVPPYFDLEEVSE